MNRLLIVTAASLFLLVPIVQHQIYGAETTSTTVIQQNNVVTDESIRVAVRNAIISDIELAKFVNGIQIAVDKGVVTLSGAVDSSSIKSNIESKVQAVTGVKKVINNLEVKQVSKVK